MTPDELRQKMEKLSSFIESAEAKVRSGTMVDVSRLDREVNTICQQCAAIAPQDAITIQPVMADLIGKLEKLAAALHDYKDSKQP